MQKKIIYPQDKIIRSRPWKWITIVATILGIITAGWFFYDKLTTDNNRTIVQDVSPETREKIKNLKPGETVLMEKVGGSENGPE